MMNIRGRQYSNSFYSIKLYKGNLNTSGGKYAVPILFINTPGKRVLLGGSPTL